MADALQMLRDDHKHVKEMFKQYEETDGGAAKLALAKNVILELRVHSALEEEIFYPAVREESNADELQMDEAEEEHHVVDLIMAELEVMRPSSKMDAKFTVLAENVKHHIDEEESEMLPKAAELGMARMNELGAEMEERKTALMAKMQKPNRSRASTTGKARSRSGIMGGTAGRTTKKTAAQSGGSRNGRSPERKAAKAPVRRTTTTRTGTAGRAASGTKRSASPARKRSAASATKRSTTTARTATGTAPRTRAKPKAATRSRAAARR